MSRRRGTDRAGFTLLELLATLILISILGGVAIPQFRNAAYRTEARKIMTDVAAVRVAIYEYREDHDNQLPRSAGWNRIPTGLEPYLNNVDFSYKNFNYRIVTNRRRARVDLYVRYPRRDPVGYALRAFEAPGNDSGSMTWNVRRSRFRLLNNNR